MVKSSKAEVEQRITDVYKLLLRRESTATIVHFAARTWGVAERQAKEYIAKARDRIKEEATEDRQMAIAEHLALRRDLYNRAYKDKQWAIAFQIAQDESKLLGLYFQLADHLKAAIASGYSVYEPGSPEDQAANQAIADDFQCEVEIGLASPPEASLGESEEV